MFLNCLPGTIELGRVHTLQHGAWAVVAPTIDQLVPAVHAGLPVLMSGKPAVGCRSANGAVVPADKETAGWPCLEREGFAMKGEAAHGTHGR